MKKIISFLSLLLAINSTLTSQYIVPPPLIPIIDSILEESHYYLNFNFTQSPNQFFSIYKPNFSLNSDDSFHLYNTKNDVYGYTHSYFTQLYKNIEIENSDIHLQTNNSSKSFLNGKIHQISNLSTNALISETQAINNSRLLYPIDSTLLDFNEFDVKKVSVKLKIVKHNFTYRLCYVVNLYSSIPIFSNLNVYIDAKTGAYLMNQNVSRSHNSKGCTIHYGKQNFITLDSTALGYFSCRPRSTINYPNSNIYLDTTRNIDYWTNNFSNKLQHFNQNGIFLDSFVFQNYIINTNTSNLDSIACNGINALQRSANEAHWLVGRFIDMVQNQWHTRIDSSTLSTSFVCSHDPDLQNTNDKFLQINFRETPSFLNNAFYSNSSLLIGRRVKEYDKEKNDIPVYTLSADLIGHEMGHFLIENLRGGSLNRLAYQRDIGAIEEGMADIFGYMLERYISTNNYPNKILNWTIGEDFNGVPLNDVYNNTTYYPYVRDNKNPTSKNMPNHLLSSYWKPSDEICCQTPVSENDNCWVHQNSSLMSKWFQLLVDGGVNKNSPYQYPVSTVPSDSIIRLLIHTIKFTMDKNTNYQQLYDMTLNNSRIMFGNLSPYVTAIRNAWWSVGVGHPVRTTRQAYIIPHNADLASVAYIRDSSIVLPTFYLMTNKDFILEGNFYITPGVIARFTNCNFYIKNNGKIEQLDSSYLIIDSCLLTSKLPSTLNYCNYNSSTFWKGIWHVPNTTSCIQNKDVNPTLSITNSQIEYAETAINSGSLFICDQQPSSSNPWYRNQYGGRVYANNVKFFNNVQDIFYARSDYKFINLYVKKCQFGYSEKDAFIKKGCIYIKQNYNSDLRQTLNVQRGFLPNTKNDVPIEIDSCQFSTIYQYYEQTNNLNGIEVDLTRNNKVFDMSLINITNSSFSGFKKAIKGSGLSKVNIKYNDIANSEVGIELNLSTVVNITKNKLTRLNYSIDLRNSALDDNKSSSILNTIDSNDFEYTNDLQNLYPYINKKEIYLSNVSNTNIIENNVYSKDHFGKYYEPAYVGFHILGSSNTRVKGNSFVKEPCMGYDQNWNLDNNCIQYLHHVPVVWERQDDKSGFFVKNYISDWWTRGVHAKFHNRNVMFKCNSFFPNRAPDHTVFFIDSGELRNQGVFTVDKNLSCEFDYYPAANTFPYQGNATGTHASCNYPLHNQQALQNINPIERQIAFRPFGLSTGYQLFYYTQSKDIDNISTPSIKCYSTTYTNVTNCPSSKSGYKLTANTCSESNVYRTEVRPNSGNGDINCNDSKLWVIDRRLLKNDLFESYINRGFNEMNDQFELQDITYQRFINLVSMDEKLFSLSEDCLDLDTFYRDIEMGDLATPKIALIERCIQRGNIAKATSIYSTLNNSPQELNFMYSARRDHFYDEYQNQKYMIGVQLSQANKIINQDNTTINNFDLNHLKMIRDNYKGASAIKAEALIEQFNGDKIYHKIQGVEMTWLTDPVTQNQVSLIPLSIFPNPNSGQFKVDFQTQNQYSTGKIIIYNIQNPSQIVFERNIDDATRCINEDIDLPNMPMGIYAIVLILDDHAKAGSLFQLSY